MINLLSATVSQSRFMIYIYIYIYWLSMKKCLPYIWFIYVVDNKAPIKTDTVGIKNTTSLRHIKKDDDRDDDCVMVDNVKRRNGIENKTQFNDNIFHLQNGNIYLTFYGHDFKFIDVPGDGDFFIIASWNMVAYKKNSMAYKN